MNWEETLDRYGSLIEERLRGYFEKVCDESRTYHPSIEKLYSALKEFVLRKGKRLASCSTLLIYKGYTGEVDDRILRVCVGVELYRHSILIHDDLIDRDDFRRGGKTLHRTFAEKYGDRFGGGTAVFAGDVMYALALQAVLGSGFSSEKMVGVMRLLSEEYSNVNESQVLDLLFEYKEPDVEEWYVMASKRAASLFKTTVLVGAILSDAPDGDFKALEEAAANVGYSFDIQDDIIDTFASREQYGRPPGGDLTQGKKPLYMIYTSKLASQEKLKALEKLVRREHLSPEELESIKTVIRESGALEAARKKSRGHAERAKALIAKTSLSDETKEFFDSFITYVEGSLNWYK